ncbi:hypothetical protein GOP47_0008295 [Adiantum capillus-veneris]|uniref:Uncharacterized protein n=1 Tax=Adiantum capillus-veneris TaxID=13818 RepID=A0A9D4UY03_ADICA|nr:hypothetical protein GOP47_0008295 [Adiantum capillus-veneris]
MGVKDRGSPCKSTLSSSRSLRSDGYYLECRKDAQCECSMCKASISATLDLRQPLQPSSKENQPWPPPFPCSSPVSSSFTKKRPLHTQNPYPSRPLHHCRFRITDRAFWLPVLLLLPFIVLLAIPWVLPCFSQMYFSHESFVELAQRSLVRIRLLDRLDFIQRRMSWITKAASVSNCTGYGDDAWKLTENGHLIHSRCIMYASSLEMVSVWGSASTTAGILGRSLVDRSFTVLAGRVMEWEEGRIQSVVHPEGSSWTMSRWAASAIVLDINTWILEYKKTPFSTGFGSLHSLKHVVLSAVAKVANNVKLYIDTAFFVRMQGLDMFSYQALSAGNPITPT